jgi:hypothetical protein
VEPEGEFQGEPLHILDRKETLLQNKSITHCNGRTLIPRRPLGNWKKICLNLIQFYSERGMNIEDNVVINGERM